MREMPTSGKLVAGICFAIVGYFAAHFYVPGLPEAWRISWFLECSAALGFLVGWLIMGRKVGETLPLAATSGVGTSVWLLIWALLGFSVHEMLQRSLDKRYNQPMEAVGAVFELIIFFAKLLVNIEVLGVLLIGGIISGVLTELAHRLWR